MVFGVLAGLAMSPVCFRSGVLDEARISGFYFLLFDISIVCLAGFVISFDQLLCLYLLHLSVSIQCTKKLNL